MKTKFRTKYERRDISHSYKKAKKLTDPQYAPDCSVDGILRRYGAIPRQEVPQFGCDCTQFGDMSECMQKVQDGLDHFMSLPASVRERFGSDPRAFYIWLSNPDNVGEAVKLGLMVERKVERSEKEILEEIAKSVTAQAASPSQG